MSKRRKFLLASVLALQNSNFIYPSCEKCFSRIFLVSTRSNCPKCGSVGETENASYRYKLSLKVAASNRLFGITVFGTCLDTFFGLTATDLYRYLQDPNGILRTLNSDTIQNLITKAVETCFVGQCFIFGVTNFENYHGQDSDSTNFLKQCLGQKREVKALVACQLLLPDPGVAGFTVIDYFHQLLQLSDFRKLHSGSQTTNTYLPAFEQSNSDLSSTCGSDGSSFFESHVRNDFSRFWQPSLELTSIISQQTDDDDFSASEARKTTATHHQDRKWTSFVKATSSTNCCETNQGSCSNVSCENEKTMAQKSGKEPDLQTNKPTTFHNSHEIGIIDYDLFPLKMQESIELNNKKSSHSAVETRYSQRELTCYQHHDVDSTPNFKEISTCFPSASFRLKELTAASQDCDLEIWDDLPFSESLDKFLAVIENEVAVSQTETSSKKSNLGNDINKLHADHSRLSVSPQRTTGALHIPLTGLGSSEANLSKVCEANLTPNVQKESPPDNTKAVTIRNNGRDIFQPNAYLSAVLPSSKGLETVTFQKSSRILSHRAEISHKHYTSENNHSCLNVRYFCDHEEKSLSEMNEKLTALHSTRYNDISDPCNLRSEQCYSWAENQGDSFAICRKLTYPVETLCSSPNKNKDTLKEVSCEHINNLTQNYFASDGGSYNASADLFDDSAKEMDIETEMSKKSQDILIHGGKSSTKSHQKESDFSLRSLSENSSLSSQKLSLQSISASPYQKTYSSPPHIQSDSECDFEDCQDFVPCSQSTPVAGFHGIKWSFKKLPAFYANLETNYNKRKTYSENYKQQATSICPKYNETPKHISKSPIMSGIIRPVGFNGHPTTEYLETDSDEWIPPSTEKGGLPEILEFQARNLRKCLVACNSPVSKELPRKKLKYIKQRTKKCLHKDISTSSDRISKGLTLELGSCSEIKCCLPYSENQPFSVSETKGAWSPELFSQKVT